MADTVVCGLSCGTGCGREVPRDQAVRVRESAHPDAPSDWLCKACSEKGERR